MSAFWDEPRLLLVNGATEPELRELIDRCDGADLPPLHACPIDEWGRWEGNAPRILFIGEGEARRVSERLGDWGGEFDLVISHDDSLFEQRTLLARTPRILAAPYEEPLLLEHLEAVSQGPTHPDPIAAELLALSIIGDSPAVKRLLRAVTAVANYDTPVLIHGETGTGKELVARAVHYCGDRADYPFIPVNCGALNDELLLAELFGYEKGAFTDAKSSRPGLVAQADHGTLLLDEVDSLSLKAQAALLRFLQEKEYRPLGSDRVCHADVRVISATNRDLAELVAQGRFREDLFYRLHVVDLQVPPLRERGGDLQTLATHFLEGFSRQYGEPAKTLHPVTLRWMREYPWPGNVRELENYLHRIFVMTPGPSLCIIDPKGDPIQLLSSPPARGGRGGDLPEFQQAKAEAVAQFEQGYLRRILRESRGNVSEAARRAGKERRAFDRLLKKHGIDRREYR